MKFEPGKYFIGDLCYVLSDEDWDKVCSLMGESDGGNYEINGKSIFLHHTAHGDGEYYDQTGSAYPVDSGTIGIAPLEICTDVDDIFDRKFGSIQEFNLEFSASYVDGTFYFESIIIPTDKHSYNDEDTYW